MKRVWIALAILALLFGAMLAHSCYMGRLVQGITATLEEAEARAEEGDWEQAAQLTEGAREKWDAHHAYVYITLRHNDTDSVYIAFREVEEFLQCREGGEYSAANAHLIAKLELLSEAEQLSLENIL